MILQTIRVYRFTLPLKMPQLMLGRELRERSGFIVRIEDDAGYEGMGEIAPFPGLSRESADDALRQIRQVAPLLIGKKLPSPEAAVFGLLPSDESLYPSVRFGFESAFAERAARLRGQSLPYLFHFAPAPQVMVNGLLSGSFRQVLKEASDLLADGFRVLKLKVGRHPAGEDIRLVRELANRLPAGGRLRLDANRAWALPEAVRFAAAVHDLPIEYIEEPLKNIADLPRFLKASRLPVALDESLPVFRGELPPGIRAVVLKPGVTAGVQEVVEIARAARSRNILPVFSSPFYSGLGSRLIAGLAAALAPPTVAAGLHPVNFLADDILMPPFRVAGGMLPLAEIAAFPFRLNERLLKQVWPA